MRRLSGPSQTGIGRRSDTSCTLARTAVGDANGGIDDRSDQDDVPTARADNNVARNEFADLADGEAGSPDTEEDCRYPVAGFVVTVLFTVAIVVCAIGCGRAAGRASRLAGELEGIRGRTPGT
jgi:hypothetical protein